MEGFLGGEGGEALGEDVLLVLLLLLLLFLLLGEGGDTVGGIRRGGEGGCWEGQGGGG